MSQRSFSLANATKEAKKQRKILASNFHSHLSDESKLNESTHVEDFINNEGTVGAAPLLSEAVMNVNSENLKPRKATPVKKPSVNTVPGPVLRPKTVPRLAQPAPEKPTLPISTTANCPTPSGRPIEPKAVPFGDRYERITTYLEKPLFSRVHDLHERGEIAKIASLLNAAIREYLDSHYPSP